MLLRVGSTKFFFIGNKFYMHEAMNFIRLQGLAAGTVSGRNNGLLRCYVEFPIQAKIGFSYDWSFYQKE